MTVDGQSSPWLCHLSINSASILDEGWGENGEETFLQISVLAGIWTPDL